MDNVCIICREEMVTGAKRLPCNHIFHTRWERPRGAWASRVALGGRPPGPANHCLVLTPSCLRSWFQRQQTCPTCRMDVLRASLPTQSPPPPEPADQGPPPAPHAPPHLPQPPNCEWPFHLAVQHCWVLALDWEWEILRSNSPCPLEGVGGPRGLVTGRDIDDCSHK